jgi:hypothetical protein
MIPARFAGDRMRRFAEGRDRKQSALFPQSLDDWIDENNPVRVIDAFVDRLDLADLGFGGVEPAETGRPAYRPSALLKLCLRLSQPGAVELLSRMRSHPLRRCKIADGVPTSVNRLNRKEAGTKESRCRVLVFELVWPMPGTEICVAFDAEISADSAALTLGFRGR